MSRSETTGEPSTTTERNNVPDVLTFDGLAELEAVAEQVPAVTRRNTESENPETGEMETVSWRDTLWTDEPEPNMAGNVSSNQHWYKIIQYGDILQSVVAALDARSEDLQPTGGVKLSRTRHRMTATIDLNRTIEPAPGDEIDLQLHISAGHSGSKAIRFQVGAERLVCSNGMVAFVADATFRQTHQNALRRDRIHDALALILEGDVFEERLADAQDATLRNSDEALLVISEVLDADYLFDDPIAAIRDGIDAEVADSDNPSLYETYQAATYALSHRSSKPDYILADAHEDASRILECSHDQDVEQERGLPDPETLGSNAVEQRASDLLEGEPERFDGEREVVRSLTP